MAHAHKVGLVVGALIGGWHLVWAILVATGLAQALYDFILWAHMIHLNLVIGPFDMGAVVVLIIMTALMGYVVGVVAAWVWNRVHSA